jgi:hypothetical protein
VLTTFIFPVLQPEVGGNLEASTKLTKMLATPEPVIDATELRYIVEAKVNCW